MYDADDPAKLVREGVMVGSGEAYSEKALRARHGLEPWRPEYAAFEPPELTAADLFWASY